MMVASQMKKTKKQIKVPPIIHFFFGIILMSLMIYLYLYYLFETPFKSFMCGILCMAVLVYMINSFLKFITQMRFAKKRKQYANEEKQTEEI